MPLRVNDEAEDQDSSVHINIVAGFINFGPYRSLSHFSSALTSKDATRLADETDNIAEARIFAETEGVALQDMPQAYLPANGMVRVVNGDQKAVMTITKKKSLKIFLFHFTAGNGRCKET